MSGDSTPYFGFERRREQRRVKMDRRELLRFELDKEPRRRNHGRRKGEAKDLWDNLGS